MQRGLSSTGLLPIAVIFSIYIKGRWSGMKAGHPRRSAPRGQTWGLIKAQPSQPQTGFEVRHIKSMGSKVRHRTDLHLTLQLEMVISRCNDDPCLNVRDDTSVGDTRHLSECVRTSTLTLRLDALEDTQTSIKALTSLHPPVHETHRYYCVCNTFKAT